MNIQKLKLISLLFFISTLVGLIYSAFLFTQLQEKNLEIGLLNKKLERTQEALTKALREERGTDNAEQNPNSNYSKVERIKNSIYKFGLYSVGQDRQKVLVEKYLKRNNFKIVEGESYDKPPPWYSKNGPTIFYYSKENLKLAKSIKSDLDALLGVSFKLQVGAGTGVTTEERPFKLNIHLI